MGGGGRGRCGGCNRPRGGAQHRHTRQIRTCAAEVTKKASNDPMPPAGPGGSWPAKAKSAAEPAMFTYATTTAPGATEPFHQADDAHLGEDGGGEGS